MRVCPKGGRFNALTVEEEEEPTVITSPMVLTSLSAAAIDCWDYIDHEKVIAIVDTGSSLLFVADRPVNQFGLECSLASDRLTNINTIAEEVFDVPIQIGS